VLLCCLLVGSVCAEEALYAERLEFLTWASMRGQLLQRTVHGMM
jgi:hypothetical protein